MEFKIDGKLDDNRKNMAVSRYVSVGYFDTYRFFFCAAKSAEKWLTGHHHATW